MINNIKISAIASISKNRGLGKDNKLLFHIPGDLPRFKQITSGHPIIMGRKTFESIGRPLPNRYNIVISHSGSRIENSGNCVFVTSLEIALQEAKEHELKKENEKDREIFIIGGGQIFQQALPMIDRLYLTVVDREPDADTFFPDYSDFTKVIEKEDHEQDDNSYTFLTLER